MLRSHSIHKAGRKVANCHGLASYLVAAACLLVLCGCDGTIDFSRILLADLDQPMGDTPLAVALPGLPNGDRAENIEGVSVTTNSEIPGQCLRIAGQIDFIPVFHGEATKYTISWTGFRPQIGATVASQITFLDNDGDIALKITFGLDGKIHLEAGEDEMIPDRDFDSVGHEFNITMRPGQDRFDFEFTENDGTDSVKHQQLQFQNVDFDKLGRIRVEGGIYFLDDLSVFVSPPL